MASPSSTANGVQNPSGAGHGKSFGLIANAKKQNHSFIQFAAMTGILLLSCRSLSQKYRIHNLSEDNAALKEEQEGLVSRRDHIKQSLLDAAALEPTGAFAARLRLLFGDDSD